MNLSAMDKESHSLAQKFQFIGYVFFSNFVYDDVRSKIHRNEPLR